MKKTQELKSPWNIIQNQIFIFISVFYYYFECFIAFIKLPKGVKVFQGVLICISNSYGVVLNVFHFPLSFPYTHFSLLYPDLICRDCVNEPPLSKFSSWYQSVGGTSRRSEGRVGGEWGQSRHFPDFFPEGLQRFVLLLYWRSQFLSGSPRHMDTISF